MGVRSVMPPAAVAGAEGAAAICGAGAVVPGRRAHIFLLWRGSVAFALFALALRHSTHPSIPLAVCSRRGQGLGVGLPDPRGHYASASALATVPPSFLKGGGESVMTMIGIGMDMVWSTFRGVRETWNNVNNRSLRTSPLRNL